MAKLATSSIRIKCYKYFASYGCVAFLVCFSFAMIVLCFIVLYCIVLHCYIVYCFVLYLMHHILTVIQNIE